MNRPSIALLESAYHELFSSTLDNLIDSAIYGRLFHGKQNEEGVAGRSIAWKLFLSPQPPLTAGLNPHPVPPLESLRHSRERYVSLLKEKMRAPDGSYEEGFQAPGDYSSTPPAPRKPDNWNLNNPLSLDSSNPWHAYFSALESRNTIRQDVERTFPEIPYFRSHIVQNEMTQILFLHAGERESVGYRQGMHELLACVYRAVDYDSVERGVSRATPQFLELCDRMYVAADAYTLFGAIMQRMEVWYEWRAPIADPMPPTSPPHIPHFLADGETVPVNVLANGQLNLKPYMAPIVPACTSLMDEKLRVVDPHLWEKLREGGVEAQMYGIRWLRLLFTREFSLDESMVIWDGLLASVAVDPITPSVSSFSQPGFQVALWLSVAMLIRIRNSLIPGDYTTQLTHLLRYPDPSSLGGRHTSNAPELLLGQAQLLMMSPTLGTGASIVMQNRNELGIPVEVPDPPSPPHRRRRASAIAATAPPTISQGRTAQSHDRPRLQDMITNRLMDANESLGLQRGFLSTISELRKNLPDLSQTLIRTPSWNGSSISLVEDGSPSARSPTLPTSDFDERPPWEPRPRSEIEQEISDLRTLLKTLGDAVGWAVDVLLLDEDEPKETKLGEKTLRQKKTEAIECMAYVRDVLSRGGKGEIDEERLVSEVEYKRRRQGNRETGTDTTTETRHPLPPKPVVPPPRIASSEIVPQSLAKLRIVPSTTESTTPISSLTRTPIAQPQSSHAFLGTPLSSVSSRARQASHPKPKSLTTIVSETRKVPPPWEHTPSHFSGDSPYAIGSLPRLPPPSTTGPLRKLSDISITRKSPTNTTEPPDSPGTDPLGVLH